MSESRTPARLIGMLISGVSTAVSVVTVPLGTAEASTCTPTPPATACASVLVWPIVKKIGSQPTVSVVDENGDTEQVAADSTYAKTVVTAIENSRHEEGSVGIIFWNPETNAFKWFGVTEGFPAGIAMDRSSSSRSGHTSPLWGSSTYGRGDVWATVEFNPAVTIPPATGNTALYVNLEGTNRFRHFHLLEAALATVHGVAVDQSSGKVWFTDEGAGMIGRLDPAVDSSSNPVLTGSPSVAVQLWSTGMGSAPHSVTVDGTGRVYATVSKATVTGAPLAPSLTAQDAIVRIDPQTNELTAWPVTTNSFTTGAIGAATDSTPDGIAVDGYSNVWFVETQASRIGMLDPSANRLAEVTKGGVTDPQQITTGSSNSSQAEFTEGAGDAVSIVTQPATAPVQAVVVTMAPRTVQVGFHDTVRTPLTANITPVRSTVQGIDPPGITRFTPMPAPPLHVPQDNFPAGITSADSNAVLGNYIDRGFMGNSAVFHFSALDVRQEPPPAVEPPEEVEGEGRFPAGDKEARFGFEVERESPGGPVEGELQYVNRSTGEVVHSVSVGDLVVAGNTATFSGACTNKTNGTATDCSFKVTVQDNGRSGSTPPDHFKIEGTGLTPAEGDLTRGNINIHKAD
jgi:streptogramin lyase